MDRSKINNLLSDFYSNIKDENLIDIQDKNRLLKASDLKEKAKPEEYTKERIIRPIFNNYKLKLLPERRFQITRNKKRWVDFSFTVESSKQNFLCEAKKYNEPLEGKSDEAAVNQLLDIFLLAEAKENYDFGIATNGKDWIIVDNERTIKYILDINNNKDLIILDNILNGQIDPLSDFEQEEIGKRFYEWYRALIFGGSYQSKTSKKKITIIKKNSFISNIANVHSDEDIIKISQILFDRLIFIKLLMAKNIIKVNIFEILTEENDYMTNELLRQLFFEILNTPVNLRADVKEEFKNIPYLNGDLFERSTVEKKFPNYKINSSILKLIFEFLNNFKFVGKTENSLSGSLDPEILGYIFEKAMNKTTKGDSGSFYTSKKITNYLTHNLITDRLLIIIKEYLLGVGYRIEEIPVTLEELYIEKPKTLNYLFQYLINNFSLCDNSCGSGAFLLSSCEFLFNILKRLNSELRLDNTDITLRRIIISKIIYGVDINPNAVEIAKLRLWFWFISNIETEKVVLLPNLKYNIKCGNSLLGDSGELKLEENEKIVTRLNDLEKNTNKLRTKEVENKGNLYKEFTIKKKEIKSLIDEIFVVKNEINLLREDYKKKNKNNELISDEYLQSSLFQWPLEFIKIMKAGGFDVIIGNPPWGAALNEFEKIFYKKYYQVAQYNIETYSLFIERSVQLLKPNGKLGLVLPQTFLEGDFYSEVRKFMLDNLNINKIINIDMSFFEGITTYPLIIDVLKNVNGIDNEISFYNFMDKNERFSSLSKIIPEKITQREIINKVNYQFKINKYKFKNHILFSEICTIYTGLKTDANEELISKGGIPSFIDTKIRIMDVIKKRFKTKIDNSDKLVYANKTRANNLLKFAELKDTDIRLINENIINTIYIKILDHYKINNQTYRNYWHKVLRGSDFTAFSTINKNKINRFVLKIDTLLTSGYDVKMYNIPKILYRRTGDRPICIIENNKLLAMNNIHLIHIKDKYKNILTLNMIIGILNSETIKLIYEDQQIDTGKVFSEVKSTNIKKLPFPDLNKSNTITLNNIDKKVSEYYKNSSDENLIEIEKLVGNLYNNIKSN